MVGSHRPGASSGASATHQGQRGVTQVTAGVGYSQVLCTPASSRGGGVDEDGGCGNNLGHGGWAFALQGKLLPPAKGTSESPIYSTDHQWADIPLEPASPGAAWETDKAAAASAAGTPLGTAWSPLSPQHSPASSDERPVERLCSALIARLPEHKGKDGKEVAFTTTVARCKLNRDKVDLGLLARNIPHGNVVWSCPGLSNFAGIKKRSGGRHASVVIRPRKGSSRGVSVIVSRSGGLQVYGARSYGECVRVVRKLVSRLRCTQGDGKGVVDFPQTLDIAPSEGGGPGLTFDMAKRNFDLGVGLRLDAVRELLTRHFRVDYEPEIFPGVVVHPSERAKVIVFHTGKVFVTLGGMGEKPSTDVAEELQGAYSSVCGRIWENLTKVVNMRSVGANNKEKMVLMP